MRNRVNRAGRSLVMAQRYGADLERMLGIKYGAPIEFNLEELRPKTRGECENGIRPCPWVSCRYHLYLDVDPDTGSIKLNHPKLELDQMGDTCALDVAEHGFHTLEEVGGILNVTRERARQLEGAANRSYRIAARRRGFNDETPAGFAHPKGEGQ